MVPPHLPHKKFVRLVRNKASRYGGLRTDHRHFQVWRKLKATNLDAAYPILASLYSTDQGRTARHPGLESSATTDAGPDHQHGVERDEDGLDPENPVDQPGLGEGIARNQRHQIVKRPHQCQRHPTQCADVNVSTDEAADG